MHAKNKLHHSLLSWNIIFSRILWFDWLTAFWSITKEPEFCQIWDLWWNISNNINFHFRLFPIKTNDKIFQKIQKTYFGAIFWLFLPKFGLKWILTQIWAKKRALPVFKYSNYLTSCQKLEKTNELFLRKMPNWRTDRQTEGQTYNGDFIGPSVRQGSNKSRWYSNINKLRKQDIRAFGCYQGSVDYFTEVNINDHPNL